MAVTQKPLIVVSTGRQQRLPIGDLVSGAIGAVNVRDYGAIGNGITDDTQSIQDAIDDVDVGGTVFIPAGTYLISSTLVVDAKPCVITGAGVQTDNQDNTNENDGSVLFLANGSNVTMLEITDTSGGRQGNVVVRHLVLEGNKSNQTAGHGISIDSVRLVTIEHCRIRRTFEHGINTAATHNANGVNIAYIHNNEIQWCGERGINGNSSADGVFAANSIGESGDSGMTAGPSNRIVANHCYLSGLHGITVAGAAVLIGNRCNNSQQDGIRLTGANGAMILGNVCFNNDQAGLTRSGIRISTSTGVVISSNVCFDNQGTATQNFGVQVTDTTSSGIILGTSGTGNTDGLVSLPAGHGFTSDLFGSLTVHNGGMTVNEQGEDYDSRIEGDTATSLFVVDAGLDAVQIGTTTAGVIADFRSAAIVFNEDGADRDFRAEGDTATQLFVCDAGLDAVQIGTTVAGDIADIRAARITLKKLVNLGTAGELTIAAGVITATTSFHNVDTEADAATDDLDTINGGSEGDILILRANDDARTVVVKDGTGNIQCAGDFSMDNVQDTIMLINNGTAWLEISRSDNGA